MGWNGSEEETPNQVDRVPRQVIESKLLVALDDDDKVALVLSEDELSEIIMVIEHVESDRGVGPLLESLLEGLKQLHKEAFLE